MRTLLAHLAVFAAAAVPWLELFAIPPGIAVGLPALTVGLVAFTANSLVTIATVAGWQRIWTWWQRRRGHDPGSSKSGTRARRVFDRYGVPGLALQGPVLSGMYVAAVLALSLGAPRRGVVVWCLISNAVWTVALVAGTVAGVGLLTG